MMSEGAVRNASPFGARSLVWLIVAGVLLAAAVLALSAFGTDIDRVFGDQPGPDSKTGTGFYALKQLIEESSDTPPTLIRSDTGYTTSDLLILTPSIDARSADIQTILDARARADDSDDEDEAGTPRPTLIILPKWSVAPIRLRPGRVERIGPVDMAKLGKILPIENSDIEWSDPEARAASTGDLDLLPFVRPEGSQTIAAPSIEPLIKVGKRAMFGRLKDRDVYILADPDLLDNFGLADKRNARAALQLLAAIAPDHPGEVAFDVTLHYRPGERNLLKLMFTPPFVSVTIALFVAAILAGIATANRFGPPRREERVVAFGKAALIENITALTRLAGRTADGGARYAQGVREGLARRLRLPRAVSDETLDKRLDAMSPPGAPTIEAMTTALANARSDDELLRAARQLHDWRKEVSA